MKRWLAGLLAAAVLCFGNPCAAEEAQGLSDAEIQESVVTREDASPGSLEDNILLLTSLLDNEDVKALFRIQDVKDIASEIIWKVLVWLYQNRPVTMKILAELGLSASDIRCVEKLWDSAERLSDASQAYEATEDGKRLRSEYEAVRNDPELQEALDDLLKMADSERLAAILDQLDHNMDGDADPQILTRSSVGPLEQTALEKHLNTQSFTGQLITELLLAAEESGAVESLQKLKNNQNLWRFLLHLAEKSEIEQAYLDEYRMLMADPEMQQFARRLVRSGLTLIQKYSKQEKTSTSDAGVRPAGEEMAP